jgi:hypothetical protein
MVKHLTRPGFPKAIIAILSIFFTVMIGVTIGSYTRSSGNTGLDMAKIQKLRSSPPLETELTAQNNVSSLEQNER